MKTIVIALGFLGLNAWAGDCGNTKALLTCDAQYLNSAGSPISSIQAPSQSASLEMTAYTDDSGNVSVCQASLELLDTHTGISLDASSTEEGQLSVTLWSGAKIFTIVDGENHLSVQYPVPGGSGIPNSINTAIYQCTFVQPPL